MFIWLLLLLFVERVRVFVLVLVNFVYGLVVINQRGSNFGFSFTDLWSSLVAMCDFLKSDVVFLLEVVAVLVISCETDCV